MNETREFTPALGFHVLRPPYDRVVAMTTRERAFKGALLDQAAIEPGHHVLDVGCGTGTLALYRAVKAGPEAGEVSPRAGGKTRLARSQPRKTHRP